MFVRSLALVLVVAGCANEADSDATPVDSTRPNAVVAPRYDTLVSTANLRCDNGTEVRANVYVGSEPRVVLATQDTGMVLPPREAASGTRYASDDESIAWWSKGDSATLTFRGTTTTCAPADGIEF